MKMKKLLIIILTFTLVLFIFAGCGPKAVPPAEAPADTSSAAEEPAATPAASDSLTPAQAVWNGEWFGFMWVTSTKGAYDHLEDDVYDAFLFIDLDKNDEGAFEIYLEDDEYPIITANVIADDYHIEAVDGWFWDTELDARMWWTRFDEDFEGNRIMFADHFDDPEGDGSFDYMFVFRPWGELWEQEVRDGLMMPPGFAYYLASLDGGGSGSGGGGGSGSDTSSSPASTGGDTAQSKGAAGTLSVLVPDGFGALPFESALGDDDPYGVKVFIDTGDDYDSLFSLGLSISVFLGGEMIDFNIKRSDFNGASDIQPLNLGNYTWKGYKGDLYDVPTVVLFADDGSDVISVVMGMKNSKQTLSLDDADVKAIISSIALKR